MSNKKKMGGIKKGLIVSLIGAVVLMSVLLGTINVRATTSASLYGSVSSYAPQWMNASSDGACVLQLKVTLAGATGGIDSVSVTFNNVTGNFNATTDFMPLANGTNSGVMLYYDTNGNGFQSSDTRLFFDNVSWVIPYRTEDGGAPSVNNTNYTVRFDYPTGIETTGDKYVYVVVKTNTTAYDGAKFNVSVAANNITGNDGTVTPTSDLFSDFTTTIDGVAPGDLSSVTVNNYTVCSNWTTDPYFIINWTSGGDNGSGVSDVYYKLDTAPTTYNDGTSCTTNYTLDIRTINSTAGNHTLYLWAVDYAQNKGNNTLLYLRYDTTAPTLNSIIISDTSSGNTTWSDSSSVTLTLSATDSASGMGTGAKMSFSNDGTTWSANETYAASKTWTLASGADGTRTVYFRAKDVAGNENTTGLSDAIILDTTAPSVVNNGTTYNNSYGFATYNDTITLWANITDDPLSIGSGSVSGILFNATGKYWYVMINLTLVNDTANWTEMKNKTGDPTNFTCTVEVNWSTIFYNQSDGDKWLQINATDNSSHANTSKYILVKVDTSAPVVTNNPTVYPTFTDALGCTVNQTNATNGNTVTFNVTIWDSGSLQYKMINVTNITTDSYTGVGSWPIWLNPPGYVGRWVNLTQGAYINSTTYYYTANVTIGNASNGTIYLQVNGTDYLNNSNIVKNVNLTVDNIAPNVTSLFVDYNISLVPSNVVGVFHNVTRTWAANGENVTIHVTVQDNQTAAVGVGGSNISVVQINVNALNSSQTWVNMTLASGNGANGVWIAENITLYGATNGTKALQIKVWDNASNYNWTNYTYVNVDNPPVVTALNTTYINATHPWVTVACNGTFVNISVTVTDDDISGVQVFLNDTSLKGGVGENLTYLGPVWAILTQISGTNTWYNNTINVSATADGTYNLTINATDLMGNWNNTQNVTVTVDNQVPWPNITDVNYINTAGWASNGTKVSINITTTDNGTAGVYNVSVDLTNITYPSLGWVDMSRKGSTNNWSKENITVNAASGNYSIWFKIYDNASNLNSTVNTPLTSLNLTVKIDNTMPTVTFAGYSNVTGGADVFYTNLTAANGSANYSVANGDTIMLNVHVNDSYSNILFNSSAGANCWYIMVNATSINASQGWVQMNNTTAYAWNFTVNITIGDTIRDGNYTIFFNVTDNATNRNTTTSYPCNITIWVKGQAPIITWTGAEYPQESPSNTSAAIPGNYVTINATVDDVSGCNMSWTNGVWVDVGLITTGSAGNWTAMSHAAALCQPGNALTFSVNVTVGSAILSGTYNLTVYGLDTGGRSTNNTTSAGRMWWVNVSVDRDNPLVTNPTTEYQSGASANASASEWVNISVNIVDIPAGVYNTTVYVGEVNWSVNTDTSVVGQSSIFNSWANMSRNGTSDVYWANITVNSNTSADGAHYLQVKVLDNVGHWYNDTYLIILIQTMGPSVTVTVTLLPGSLASLGTNSTGIIGNDVSVKATTSTDVVNVSVDLSAFFNAAGYSMGNGSNVNMSYSSNGVWYYNFTLYASESAYVNNNTVCSFNATAYRSGYTGINNTTVKIDAVRPTSIINQTMSQWWNNTLWNAYSGCIFLNWTHSEAGWWDATFKLYYKVGSAGTWTEWSLSSNTSAMCTNFTSITEGETYYFRVVATDYAGNVEASRYVSGSIIEAYNLTTGDVSTTVDTSFPSSLSIVINNDDLFNNTMIVNLTISGYDAGSGLGAILLSNDGVTWQTWYDFVSPVTNVTGNQQYSSIYGNVVVWIDIATSNIYAYNIANKTLWRITSSGDVYGIYPPAIYGDYIVYCNGSSGDYNIYAFNIATGATTAVCTDTGNQMFPAIYGTVVVWQGNVSGSTSYNIYKYDISNPGAGITQLTTSGKAYTPAIYGNYVVYADNRTGNNNTYMYTLGTSTETAVCTAAGAQQYPAIYGNYIVWQDYRNGNCDIYMYNVATAVETAVCANTSTQEYPKVYDNYIVWQDNRYDSNYDIFMYTISTGKETQVTADTTAQGYPAVYGSYVVWEDNRGSLYSPSIGYDIYMQQIGTSKTLSYINWDLTLAGANATAGTKTVYIKIRDWANNTVVNITDIIIYDITPPAGLTIVINDGDNITTDVTRTIRLNLSAYDPTTTTWDLVVSNITPGYYLIQFRNKTSGSWGAWSDWMEWSGNSSTAGYYYYTLSPGDGDRIVEFRIKDRAGNIANPVSDSILLNTGVPTITCTIIGTQTGNDTAGNPWYNLSTGAGEPTFVRVNLSATDAQSISILWYKVTFDNGTTTGWKSNSTIINNWANVSGTLGATLYDANFSFTVEGIHMIEYYALNLNASTNSSIQTLYIRIDKTKSNITLSPSATAGNMNCFSTTLTITINCNDTTSNATPSGVNWTRFRVWKEGAVGTYTCGYYNATGVWRSLDSTLGQWVNYTGAGLTNLTTLRLLAEGNYTIEVNTTDYAGNSNVTNGTVYMNLTYIRIDMTNPAPSFPANGIQGNWGTVVSSIYYTNSTWVVLRPNAYDSGLGPAQDANSSGLRRFQVSNDGIDWYGWNATGVLELGGYVNWTVNGTVYNWNLTAETVLGNYNKTVYFRIYDNASNYADVTIWIILDTHLPTSTVSVSGVSPGVAINYIDAIIINGTNAANVPFNITWSGSDDNNGLNGSGINQFIVQYTYSDDGEVTWTGWIWNHTVGASGTQQFIGVDGRVYYFRCNATDRLIWRGNYSTLVKVIVDTTVPTSSVDTIATYWHNTGITITATASDTSSGTASGVYSVDLLYKYSSDNSTWPSSWTLFGTDTTTESWSWDFTFTSDGYYKFCTRAKDRGYNVETALPADYDVIAGYDTVAPTTATPILSGTAGENSWYTTDVSVTLTATDPSPSSGGLTIEYYVDTGAWITYTVAFTITTDGIHTVYYRTTDRAGNVESTGTKEVKVDKTAPTAISILISGGADYTKSETVTLTVSASDATSTLWKMSFKNEVTGTWSDWLDYAEGPTGWSLLPGDDGLRTVYFKVKDYAGLVSDVTYDQIPLDKTAPTTEITVPSADGTNGWYRTDVTVTLTATDTGSGMTGGLAKTEYRIDGGGLWITGTSYTFTAEGPHTIEYRSTDNIGNPEAIKGPVTVKLDKTRPTSSVLTLSVYQTTSTSFTVQWTGSDATSGSGVIVGYTIQVKIGAGDWSDWKTGTLDTSATYTGAEGNTYYFRSKATDQAGNVETDFTDTGDTSTTIDTKAPTTDDNIVGGWHTTAVDVTLTELEPDTSGVAHTYYKKWLATETEPDYTPYTGPVTISTDGKWKFKYYSVDNAGNTQTPVGPKDVWLDKVAPVIGSLTPANGAVLTSLQVTISAVFTDDTSGIDTGTIVMLLDTTPVTTYSYAGNTISYTATLTEGAHTVTINVNDKAGKVATQASWQFTISLPDTTPPANLSIIITGTGETVYTTSTTVTLALSAVDAVSMMISNDAVFSGATWETYNTSKTWTLSTGDGVKTVYFKCKDTAGNVADPVSDTIILDTTAPTATITADKTAIYTGETVQFAGASSEATGAIYSWNFGDETALSAEQSPSHTYTETGTYTATLTVTDAHGLTSTTQITITVNKKPEPTPGFEVLALIAAMGVAVILLRKKH